MNWNELGFTLVPTDYMYVMKCSNGEKFSEGEINRYKSIELSPSSGVLNYGQVTKIFIVSASYNIKHLCL